MNDRTRVVLYGTYDGFVRSTVESLQIAVRLDGGERVEIPSECAISADQMVDKNKIKLKDVIARIQKQDLGTQKVWLNEILNELGSDYGTLKYKAGYEQGKFEASMIPYEESQKVTIPQFVADWYEEHKDNLEYSIGEWMRYNSKEEAGNHEFFLWLHNASKNPVETLVKMKLFGYTVAKEKKYLVKIKGFDDKHSLLKYGEFSETWYFDDTETNVCIRRYHTREQIEEAGFGEMFNSPLFEVEEVEK